MNKQYSFSRYFIAIIIFIFSPVIRLSAGNNDSLPKLSQPGVYQGYSEATYHGYSYTSHYLPMTDSTLLAADIFLPKHLKKGVKVPTILYQTRYVRSIQAKCPFNLLKDPLFGDISESEIKFFTCHGYACVIVDVRGTGASTGKRRMEFSPEEVADGKTVVDWIISQPWSDQKVGTTGVSYVGTTAELLLINKHPNVKACIPRSNIFDLYNDMVFPGGVCLGDFVRVWGATTLSLDQNDFKPFTNKAKLLLGVHTVKGDAHRKIWNQAVAIHKKNFNVSKGVEEIKYRDDIQPTVNASLNDFSISNHYKDVAASGTPIYRMDGWYDAALARGCIDGWLNTPNTRKVLIGPWDHGPRGDVSPFAKTKTVKFNIDDEMLRFFDFYLKGIQNGIDKEPALTYYTVGEEKWKSSDAWPPAGEKMQKLYLSADKSLQWSAEKIKTGKTNYRVDTSTSSGYTAGWNSLTDAFMHGPTAYPDRQQEDLKLLCFNSAPLTSGIEISGNPVVSLEFTADSNDATIFCFLEDVAPNGSVTYITEGSFRPLQRKTGEGSYKTPYPSHSYKEADGLPYKAGEEVQLTFDLLPISYKIDAGHSLRVSIAGADKGHFDLPKHQPKHFFIDCKEANPSFLQLPVVN